MVVFCSPFLPSLRFAVLLTIVREDISEIDEKQLVLYAQMANLVNLILELPGIGIKEIAENFSKVSLRRWIKVPKYFFFPLLSGQIVGLLIPERA